MYIVKVLKRRDAASIIVAIILAFAVINILPNLTANLAGTLAGAADGSYFSYGFPSGDWKGQYLQPLVSLFLQIVLIELSLRVVIFVRGKLVRRTN